MVSDQQGYAPTGATGEALELYEQAALRGKQRDLAQALANERLALKPHSVVNRRHLARAA